MDIESLRNYCLQKENVYEEFPFDEVTLAFKVNGKIFLFTSLDETPLRFNVKCDPEKAIDWRERYDAVQPGYHMNKKHWNTIIINGTLSDIELKEMIDDSYLLVASKKKK